MITVKAAQEIEYMRKAGRIVAETHDLLEKAIRPGITTEELDSIAEEYIRSQGAIPSFKGYNGFPASICASVNAEVVHGIPSLNKLKDGDIISIDIGVMYKGYHGDAARTHPVGNISEEAKRLIKVTRESFYKGVKYAVEGNRLSDISSAIQKYVEQHGYSVVRDFVGHGIGQNMHEEPQIPNYGPPGRGPRLLAGMTLAIEPMVNMGKHHVKILPNRWTVVTVDGSLSAHYEHTVAITKGYPEILTGT
ncbi:MAG: methionyl aminopeptidase [Petroclostridium sp.]|jgi:methionyl aminopeptidase|uniref:type I methionyl aminopeptidase n=1 Tax=Petroclostridium xylanilyticum TaxID=1792311 RepID=UPI000B989BE1|nr:type I methionyl aminopeptidase [Petroclostridium xylanilyticum]MBZ4645211.1 map [Clostridia bacterium]MDK2809721.1 methionyl aminopeptidase [Petroclostridium sp.]